ncbi:MAG: glycoside hydrolase family 38 N-terminal domain-containing protein [Pirellulaceae bacterium]
MAIGFYALALSVLLTAGEPKQVMTVGSLDGKVDGFALAPDGWGKWGSTFQADVRFRVGTDDPALAFPFIHPGPMDAWAGNTSHTFNVDFPLEEVPAGECLLLIGVCRSHYGYPPRFTVRLNEGLPKTFATARDGMVQTMSCIVPEGVLRKGANRLAIENADGSWFQYDGLALLAYADGKVPETIGSLAVEDTVFFKEEKGALLQVLHVHVGGLWDGEGTLNVTAGATRFRVDARAAAFKDGVLEVCLPPVTQATDIAVELVTAQGTKASAQCVARPHRQWQIFIAMKTHYDLGYTEPIDAMLERASGPMLDLVEEFCDRGHGYSPDHRFIWTYSTWMLDEILRHKDEAGKKKFEDYIARGEIDWHALPFTLHSYFCGLEDITRSLYPAKELERRYGKSVAWAKQTDVPGHTRVFPQILARSGVRLLQIGANNGVRGVKTPLLFWWESPDGSRVLTQLTAGYGLGWDQSRLIGLENDPAYPYDAFLGLYVTGDNAGPENLLTVATEAEELGKRYAYPKIRIGEVEAFVDWIETHAKDQVPVVKTELNDWWIHGVASQASTTATARLARENLTFSERLHSMAELCGVLASDAYPAEQLQEGYIQSLLYSEHTWGIAGFKPKAKPAVEDDLALNKEYDAMKLSWRLKGDFARRAAKIGEETFAAAALPIAQAAAPATGGLVVANLAGWTRTDVVRVASSQFPNVKAFVPLDGGGDAPVQQMGDTLVFVAKDMPALGYRVYRAVEGARQDQREVRSETIETPFYRARVRDDGEIVSLVHVPSNLELLDQATPGLFNQYIYEGYEKIEGVSWHDSVSGGKGTGRVMPQTATWRVEAGSVATRLVVEGSLRIPDFPVQIGEVEKVVRTVTFWKTLDRIDCEVRLIGKKETAVAEAAHVAFPFGFAAPRFALEQLGSVTDPVTDVQEAGNRDTFAIQHWAHVGNDQGGVTWATVQAPIVSVGDIRIFKWDPSYVPERAHIYSSVLNNGWSTNFQEFQGGDFTFNYALRAHGAAAGPDARLGWESATPLLGIDVRQGQGTLPPTASFLGVAPENVVLVNLKRAEDGDGWIVRLYETAGRRVATRLTWGMQTPQSAAVTRLTEDPLPAGNIPLTVADKTIESTIGPFEIQTIRVKF